MQTIEARRPGRPRDEAREAALVAAALEVLCEVGYDRLTIDAVACRAKASKATIYRRWPGKPELVAEALRCRAHGDGELFPDTGSLAGDLTRIVTDSAEALTSDEGHLFIGLISAASRDPHLATLLREQMISDKGPAAQALVDRAIARKELPKGTGGELIIEVMPALIFHRFLVSGLPLDAEFAHHLVHDIVIPLLSRRSPR